jgi:hypothetical protein
MLGKVMGVKLCEVSREADYRFLGNTSPTRRLSSVIRLPSEFR